MKLKTHARTAIALTFALCAPAFAQTSLPKAPSGVCVDDNCTSTPAETGKIKWHPGHYMMIRSRHRDPAKELPQIDAIGNEATVKGVLVTWKWMDLEKSKGVYDFSSIDTYLERIKALPTTKRLIIHVYDRAWSSQTAETIPDYLKSDATYGGGEVLMSNGVVARIWNQAVMDRQIALYQAMAKRYDADPYVEGLQFSETAIAFSATYPAPSDFSDQAHATQLKRLIAAVRKSWPHTNVFLSTNYLGSDSLMEDMIKYCVDNQVIIGGPDTWTRAWIVSGKRALQADQIMRGEKGSGTDYRKTAGIKGEIQVTELGGYIATFTPTELFDVAYNINQSQYILWDRNDYYGGDEQKWSTGILPLIRSVKGKSYTSCPSSYTQGCDLN